LAKLEAVLSQGTNDLSEAVPLLAVRESPSVSVATNAGAVAEPWYLVELARKS